MAILKMLFALLLLACQSFASPVSTPETALSKRDQCAIYAPGEFKVQGADSFFLSCPGTINFALQASDGNFVVYGPNSVVLWSANTGGHQRCSGTDCLYLQYQEDGNLVEYYAKKPIWASNTAGHGNSRLYFQNTRPYIYILSARGTIIWSTGT